ncbi:ABC transporter permease [Carnobacterium pleistocenium]|uniref:ABC transporter permease n=1 Tax=Carnobacterium pleistocenium TaxID=181073 RepID=UPI00055318C2|nr:ABC transporter permease [Carnobacterium pleistocenium]
MGNVFILQWKRLMKHPLVVVMFLGLTILFVYFIGGSQGSSSINVQVYSESLTKEELSIWVDRLNKDDSIIFEATDYETAEEDIRMNEIGYAMEIGAETYQFLVGREDERLPVVDQHVNQIFREQVRLEKVRADFPDSEIEVQEFLTVEGIRQPEDSGTLNRYQLSILIGMTFYFAMFTILYLQINVVEEKKKGTWDRLIFSPLSKTQIYLGLLSHYFLVGLVQIVIAFFILTNLLNLDLGTNYVSMAAVTLAFIFTIVSLGMLISALVPSPQSLQVVIPIIATSMAMLGGAFWPLDIVNNRLLLFIAEFVPIKHGLNGMVDAIYLGLPLSQLLQPIGILLLMGILFMGIGINLMERVSNV